ncbi:hypothetical protein [Paraglaciecola sp. L1A13]|uniref:hypothetical protein n=1 Tax=Paraglaciecola sp. L1A13 TaxID=2686359 RepID=UPI00131DFB09|nr:hypothetical protein [Paraglaciecola sp. L1A13]|tara:strand:- start:495 stop:875 length:381 start_codon:yes stop_codon:yes gene_type:complete
MSLEHGNYSISVEGNIIILELSGCFNEYGTQALTKNIIATIETFHGAPFSIVVSNLAVEGFTPEAYTELNRYNIWLNTQNMVAKAMVSKINALVKIDDIRIPAKSAQNVAVFNNIPDAIKWLHSQS